ncbi:MAG: hypothetical protein HYZ95_02735, partial [Candidatus Omnitrophica bacterium]|nr:hypothetical protein [Candidatus Omnitrophota bacterium]
MDFLRPTYIRRGLSAILALTVVFLGFPVTPLSRADDDETRPILRIHSFQDEPDPFSPNGDARRETAAFLAEIVFRPLGHGGVKPGAPGFEEKLEKDRQRVLKRLERMAGKAPEKIFLLRVTWALLDPGTGLAVRRMEVERAIEPPFTLKVLPTREGKVGHFLTEEFRADWDGRDDRLALLADGSYPYQVQAVLRVEKKGGDDEGGDEDEDEGDGEDGDDGDEDDDEDLDGLRSSIEKGLITLDTTPPEVTDLAPAGGAILDDPRPAIRAKFGDALAGVDAASVSLILDGADVTGQAEITPSSIRFTPSEDLPDGLHTARLKVSDRAENLAEAETTFTVETNEPPVLAPIGDRSVTVGSGLRFQVIATDPDGDPVTLGVTPLPLPRNARFNLATGRFEFTPAPDQVGAFDLTFSASDAEFTVSETVMITALAPPPGQPTRLLGRILDTNDFVLGIETPVVGATISLLGTGFSTASGPDGRFTLSGIPAGSRILDIDAATANLAPDGSPYSGFREEITLIAGTDNVVDRPFFLPRIAMESLTAVDPGATTVVTNPTLQVTMTVPPHTAKGPDGTDFTGELSISEVPKGLAPAALPPELEPGLLITIQPVGVTFSPP